MGAAFFSSASRFPSTHMGGSYSPLERPQRISINSKLVGLFRVQLINPAQTPVIWRSTMTRTVLVSLLIGLATVLNAQKQATTEIEKLGADKFNEAIKAYAANDYAKSILLFTVADSLIGSTELVDRV